MTIKKDMHENDFQEFIKYKVEINKVVYSKFTLNLVYT